MSDAPAQSDFTARLEVLEEALVMLSAASTGTAAHFTEQLRLKAIWQRDHGQATAAAATIRLLRVVEASGLG